MYRWIVYIDVISVARRIGFVIECGYYNGAVMTRGAYILGTQKVTKSLLEAAEEGGYICLSPSHRAID